MAERREDVEEVLRLKSNPFPDGMLEAPEFPRRVYTTNVVQAVTSQIVGQTTRGPQLLKCEETGELHVTIPPTVRPQKSVEYEGWIPGGTIPAGQYIEHQITPPQGWLLRILNIDLYVPPPPGATVLYLEYTIHCKYQGIPLVTVDWAYNTTGLIESCVPTGTTLKYIPTTIDSFIKQVHNLVFDYDNPFIQRITNFTDAPVNGTQVVLNTTYLLEEI